MKIKNKLKEIEGKWYFLVIIILAYFFIYIINFGLFSSSLNFFLNLLVKIIPIFVIIFFLMIFVNYFITSEFILKHFKKDKGIKKWVFVVIGGILSSGPIYMWYPLLSDLKERGVSEGLIACFLYNRAIKIPLFPLAIVYFGLKFIIILSLVVIFGSVIQGIIINKMEVKIK